MLKRIVVLTSFLLLYTSGFATHNRSGEIIFTQNSLLTYTVSIVTYTKTSSPADRDSLEINWGDNTSEFLQRVNVLLDGDIKRNEYTGIHTYPGQGIYKCSFLDPNRDAGIVNIPGASDQVPFYVESIVTISSQLGGFNNSPRLLQPPIDKGIVGQVFIHNPNAFDPDGDSLAYHIDTCRGYLGQYIPDYFVPYAPTYAKNSYTLNPVSGDLIWDYPMMIGEYNVAIKIIEYRKDAQGHPHEIGYVIRDMQIEISAPDTSKEAQPPILMHLNDTCVEAGSLLNVDIAATQAAGNPITLTATGAPFQKVNNPATFTQITTSPAVGKFTWNTECSDIRKLPYQFVFKARNDKPVDPPGSTPRLSSLQSMRVKIVAPAPKNLRVLAFGNSATLHWNPDACPQAIAYDVYRKTDSTAFIPGPCETGLPESTGFVKIDRLMGINDTTYTDNNHGGGLLPGITYCYRIVAIFPNEVESYTSLQECVQLKQDLPIMTEASVEKTDSLRGVVNVSWAKPNPADLDTLQNHGPYQFDLYRASDLTAADSVLIHSSGSTFFKAFKDTFFVDSVGHALNTTLLNTKNKPNYYFIKFYANHFYKGQSFPASTVFLTLTPSDNRVTLKWNYNTPWTDTLFSVFWKNPTTQAFDSIASTNSKQYVDSGHANGVKRTYKIVSRGFFSGKSLPRNIINKSQEASATPVDNIFPCPPHLSVTQNCEEQNIDNLKNHLTWDNPNNSCTDDALKYAIYYKRHSTDSFPNTPLTVVDESAIAKTQDHFDYLHENLQVNMAGCYAVSSIDSVGNEGRISNSVCVDNCPLYKLPNAFTPNNDSYNDLFQPLRDLRFIRAVNMQIYDRWGRLMFSTTNPMINWDGTDQQNHKTCSSGTYYYVCDVYEEHLDEVTVHSLKGFIELLRAEFNASDLNH